MDEPKKDLEPQEPPVTEEEKPTAQETTAPEEQASTAQETPAPDGPEDSPKEKDKFFSRKNLKRNIILGAILLAIAVAIPVILSHFGPKAVAERYCMGCFEGRLDKTASVVAWDLKALTLSIYDDDEDFYEAMSDFYGVDIHSWRGYVKAAHDYSRELREEEYGKHKITAEATRVRDVSVKKLKEEMGSKRCKALEDDMDVDLDEITAAKIVTVKVKLIGEDDSYKETASVYLGKIGGQWKVLYIKYE